jgi:hemerythrin-like domain-containing protein
MEGIGNDKLCASSFPLTMTSETEPFNLSSLLNNLENPGEDNAAKKELFVFVRCLMQGLEKEDPQIYNRAKVMMDEEVQKNYGSFEEAKTTFFARIREIVGEASWTKAESESGIKME